MILITGKDEMSDQEKSILRKKKNAAPFGLAASIDFSDIQGATFGAQPINVDAYFDEEQFFYVGSKESGFTLKFRRCDLLLMIDGGEITSPPALYRRTLPPEDFKSLMTKTLQAHASTGGKAALGLGKSFEAILSTVGIDLSAEASAAASRDTNRSEETTRVVRYRIVDPIGKDRWQIGHECLGDPNSIDGALHGSYFREIPDDRDPEKLDESSITSLGTMLVNEKRKYVYLEIELRARFQDCIFLPFGEDAPGKDGVEDVRKSKIEKAITLKALQKMQKNSGFSMRAYEFIVSRCSIKMERG